MDTQAADIFYSYLKELNIKVTKNRVKEMLLSNPYYPSLAAFSDACRELNIEGAGLQTTFEYVIKADYLSLYHKNVNS